MPDTRFTAVELDPRAQGPLADMRVLDLSRLVAGNMLSLQLADFGADVIKVEPPEGDPLRDWRDGGRQLHWKTYARNKRSIVLNLRHAAARDALLHLLGSADVLIENYRPGTLEKMNLAPDVLLRTNPDVIIVRISGFGQTGPYAPLPGFGTLVEAMSGFAARTGFADREPVLPPFALADMVAGLYGAFATMTALRARDAGGSRGQVIDLSLLEAMFSVLGPEAAIYQLTQKIDPRVGSRSHNTAPRNVYETKDGRFISISASIQTMAERLFRAIGRADMIDDPRFRTNTDRVRNIDECDRVVADFIKARTLAEGLAVFEAAEVTAAPVYEIDQFIADPHVRAREIVTELPDDEMGSIPMHAVVPRLSGTPGEIRMPAPALGEHNNEILGGLGLSAGAIDDLRSRKVI